MVNPAALASRAVLSTALALGALHGCAGQPDVAPPADRFADEDLPLLARVVGEWDGQELTLQAYEPADPVVRELDGVGLATADLDALEEMSCGNSCTGADFIGVAQVSGSLRTFGGMPAGAPTPWAGEVANCGPVPSGADNAGVCSQIRVRNMYGRRVERVHAVITSLTGTGTTTLVHPHATNPFLASPDFGATGTLGLFRYGELGRSQPAGTGPATWWSFSGTAGTDGTFTYRFVAELYGVLSSETVSAGVSSTSGTAISPNQQYVVFANGGTVRRYDTTTGTTVTAPVTCSSVSSVDVANTGEVAYAGITCAHPTLGTSALQQIFATDFTTTTLVSRATTGGYAGGSSSNVAIAGNGGIYAFESLATNLVASTPTAGRTGCIEVYRATATTITHASALSGAPTAPGNGWLPTCNNAAGATPDISGDGNLIVFNSQRQLSALDTSSARDIYIYDHGASSSTYVVYPVSRTSANGPLASQAFEDPVISADGAYVAFLTAANNVVLPASSRRHVYRRSSANGAAAAATIRRVTVRVDDQPSGTNTQGRFAISNDGRFVAVWSNANDLASSGTFSASGYEVYVCDLDAPNADLQRCFVASTFQATPGAAFATYGGTAASNSAIGIAHDTNGRGFVVYQGTGSGWTGFSSSNQTFVSPVGDPRYQMPAISR